MVHLQRAVSYVLICLIHSLEADFSLYTLQTSSNGWIVAPLKAQRKIPKSSPCIVLKIQCDEIGFSTKVEMAT
jgi:hypothetical protein